MPLWAARLRSTPVLISDGDGAGLAGQLADGQPDLAGRGAGVVGKLLHFGGDDREAAPGIAGAGRLDGRIRAPACWSCGRSPRWSRRPTGPGSWRWRSRPSARPAGRPIAVSSLKPAMVPSIASRPASSLALACSDKQPRLVGRIGDPRLVGEQAGGDVLERVEHLEMVADADRDVLDVAGDVAAFDRQIAAIARHRRGSHFR